MPTFAELPLRQHAVLRPPPDHPALVTASVGPEGELVALWSTAAGGQALLARKESGGRSFPRTRPEEAPPVTVTVADRAIRIAALPLSYPFVQPLPEGRVLLAGSRARWRAKGAEENAAIHAEDGSLERRGLLGDGIQHLLTTPSGKIWAGYFDEGVIGNFGWGGANGPEPLGAAGLVRYGEDLRAEWHFPVGDDHVEISDCYALNVDRETAWACTYTEFPLHCVERDVVRTRANQVAGARALLVGGGRVAFFGGYRDAGSRLVPAVLRPEWVHAGRHRFDVTRPDGGPLPKARAIGRGPDLHVVTDTHWYRLDLDDVAAAEALSGSGEGLPVGP